MSDAPSPGRGLLILGAVAVAVVVAWFAFRDRTPADEEDVVATAPATPPPAAAPAPPPPAPPPQAAPPAPKREEYIADDGVPIMPAGPDDPHNGPAHPHPITPKHERIFAENRLIGALNGAMDVKDVPAMRRFLKQYREQYPEDENDVQEGYQVVADCFEHPGEASRSAAVRFGEEHRGSTLRRFVNRHCLEPQAQP